MPTQSGTLTRSRVGGSKSRLMILAAVRPCFYIFSNARLKSQAGTQSIYSLIGYDAFACLGTDNEKLIWFYLHILTHHRFLIHHAKFRSPPTGTSEAPRYMYLITDMACTFHWEAPRYIALERDFNPTCQFLTDEKGIAFLFLMAYLELGNSSCGQISRSNTAASA